MVVEAMAKGGIKIVPAIVAGDGMGGGLAAVLLGKLIHQDMKKPRSDAAALHLLTA